MSEMFMPQESKKFVRILLSVCLTLFVFGLALHGDSPENRSAYIQIFLFSFLDLIFLLLLFWNLFFVNPIVGARRSNKVRIMLFGFFKLVCLAFLAITLKRLRNASTLTHLMGVSIIWIGPLISGVLMKYSSKKN